MVILFDLLGHLIKNAVVDLKSLCDRKLRRICEERRMKLLGDKVNNISQSDVDRNPVSADSNLKYRQL